MKATLELAQAIRRSIMDQAEKEGCLNSETLDVRILGVLALEELTGVNEVKRPVEKPAYSYPGSQSLTDAELLRYLAYLSS